MASFGTTDSCQHEQLAVITILSIGVLRRCSEGMLCSRDGLFAGHSDKEDVLFCATKDTGATNDYYSSISPQRSTPITPPCCCLPAAAFPFPVRPHRYLEQQRWGRGCSVPRYY
eukprot:scaffold709_cov142-Skeletonema_menzelii.AAC.3